MYYVCTGCVLGMYVLCVYWMCTRYVCTVCTGCVLGMYVVCVYWMCTRYVTTMCVLDVY